MREGALCSTDEIDTFPLGSDRMFGERYIVNKGDNLWRIAAATLGRGKEWPRIWRYNNRPEVVRHTGRRIPDPDRIYVGQLLMIPRLTTLPVARDPVAVGEPAGLRPAESSVNAAAPQSLSKEPAPSAGTATTPLRDQLSRLKIPLIFRFRLGEHSWPPQDIGTAVIRVVMSGEVLLKTKESYSANVVVSGGDIEGQIARDANHAFGKLIAEQKFGFEPTTKKVTLSSMLISQSNVPNTVAMAIGTELSSDSPLPKLKAEIKLPTLQGTISGFEYVAVDVSIALELTPRPPLTSPQSLSVEKAGSRVAAPATAPAVNPWVVALGAGIVAGCAVVIVANLVEDVATGGLGLANDPLVFSATGVALARGLAMMGVAATAGLPKSSSPARVELRTTVTSL
jgi:hypothetical protein